MEKGFIRIPLCTLFRVMAASLGLLLGAVALPAHADVVLNEIFARPTDPGGDTNGDGLVHSGNDEFVEILNMAAAPVDISGWSLWDGGGARYAFAAGSLLDAGQALVVFGGGTPPASLGGSLALTASAGLSLNNSGETVFLKDAAMNVKDEFPYSAATANVSWQRSTGGWVLHSTLADAGYSPGFDYTGRPFAAAVPEPSTYAMMVVGLGLLAGALRRRSAG